MSVKSRCLKLKGNNQQIPKVCFDIGETELNKKYKNHLKSFRCKR